MIKAEIERNQIIQDQLGKNKKEKDNRLVSMMQS
jgi:hypothetical protein